jgi:glycosyltransferase involved in cell wall biosynthesis
MDARVMIGCVVIGRNEAARLPATFASVKAAGLPMIYVDSGSKDKSVAVAEAAGAMIVNLDPARPFTAARARNEGLDALAAAHPDSAYVMFLDGDCRLDPKFPDKAVNVLKDDPDCAVIVGHLHEEQTKPSIYTRLSAIEWSSTSGEIRDFGNLGGIMLARISEISAIGGFNAAMIAGEDSELGVRLSLAGKRVVKIDVDMATHRADIVRFGQWWRRSVRAGHALAHRYTLHGQSRLRDCRRAYWSTILWGGVIPVAAFAFAPVTQGLSLLLCAAYGALMIRMTGHFRRQGAGLATAGTAALFGIMAKFANFAGLVRFHIHQARGTTELVEYK